MYFEMTRFMCVARGATLYAFASDHHRDPDLLFQSTAVSSSNGGHLTYSQPAEVKLLLDFVL